MKIPWYVEGDDDVDEEQGARAAQEIIDDYDMLDVPEKFDQPETAGHSASSSSGAPSFEPTVPSTSLTKSIMKSLGYDRKHIADMPGDDHCFDEPVVTKSPEPTAVDSEDHHWSRGILLCKSTRWEWWENLQVGETSGTADVDSTMVQSVLSSFGVDVPLKQISTEPVEQEFMRTPGSFWYVTNPKALTHLMLSMGIEPGVSEEEVQGRPSAQDVSELAATRALSLPHWMAAYHGSAPTRLSKILSQGLMRGPSVTGDKPGVYCEGHHRRACCLNYMTHMKSSACPNKSIVWSVLLDLLVDRRRGRSIHSQWVQDQGSVIIQGYYVHALNVSDAINKGFLGWFRVYDRTLLHMMRASGEVHV